MMKTKSEFRTFEDLDCWKACRELRKFVAGQCKLLPKAEEYRLKDQLLRAARGATANIAEGYGRFHYQETMQYCRSARGSVYEVLDHLITANDEELVVEDTLKQARCLVEKCVALINGYVRYLEKQKTGL